MSIEFERTYIEGIEIIKPHLFEDFRGIYEKHFEAEIYRQNGIELDLVESSDLYTKKGAIRGLHFQTIESQAKLVRVIKGKVFDVAVDMRPDSNTYLKHFEIELDDNNKKSVYIPKGFAHGFLSLEDNTIFSYHSCGKYHPDFSSGLRWDDPKLDIHWPLKKYKIDRVLITENDANWNLL